MTTQLKPFRTPASRIREKIAISFSGGKSSAYMTKMILDHYKEHEPSKQIHVIFANTGQEHEETLKFIDRCDKEFGFNVTWIEGVTNPKHGIQMSYKVVDFESASRDGKPFEEVIKKYGIFNSSFPNCTGRLKVDPMNSFFKDLGWIDFSFAVGIRADEIIRVSANGLANGIFYPLVDANVTKNDVREWWADQSFNLMIPEHYGNCVWCWKKSKRKLLTIAKKNPEVFDFPARMEDQYATTGRCRKKEVRDAATFFRGNQSALDILEESKGRFEPFVDWKYIPYDDEMDEHGSCGDSCEVGADKNDLYGGYDLFDLIKKKQDNE